MTRLLSLLFLIALSGCEETHAPVVAPAHVVSAPARAPAAPRAARTVLYVGGDVLPAGSVRRSVEAPARARGEEAARFAEIFEDVTARVRADDPSAFLLVNLETPVATPRVANDAFRHLKTSERRVPAPLNAPDWIVHGLARASVDAVMLANNHTLDQGREGLAETVRAARRAGLVVTGAGFAPNLRWPITVGGETAEVAILSYLERDFPEPALSDGEPGVSVYGDEAVAEVRAAKRHHDAIVVVVHVVAELETRVKPSWREMARRLADAGADVVAIHGQHVPAPVETIRASDGREVVVAFGLGNLFSDMGSRARPGRDVPEDENKLEMPEASEGLLLRVELADGRVDARFLPLFVTSTRYFVYNGALDEPPTFRVLVLPPCGEVPLPDRWPEPLRGDMVRFVGERRDHLLTATRLVAGCDGAERRFLRAPPFRGTM